MSLADRFPWLPLSGRVAACLVSAGLLVLAFAPFDESGAAWFALVPMIVLARFTEPRLSFRWHWLAGFVFWLCSVSWVLRLSRTGTTWWLAGLAWIGLAAYCALYWGAFGIGAAYLFGRAGNRNRLLNIAVMFILAVLWTGLEYVRSLLFTGFPWNTMAVSQVRNLGVIQIASIGGSYAVSFVVVFVNAAFAMMVMRISDVWRRRERPRVQLEVAAGLVVLAGTWMWGLDQVRHVRVAAAQWPELRVVAVQPGIPQLKKWTQEFADSIYEQLAEQTQLAALGKPAMILWPETSVPGILAGEPEVLEFVHMLTDLGSPILAGSLEDSYEKGGDYYNSSFLVEGRGKTLQSYRKQHLVPFGEYLPFSRQAEWIARLAPLGFNCSPGKGPGVMTLSETGTRFAVLICFEDIMAYLSRRALLAGACLLVNQTNDAWFDDTAGSRQHMNHCVLRCVENRVSAVRSANTGVSCAIAPWGEITYMLRDGSGSVQVDGFLTAGVPIRPRDAPMTVYARYGDWLCGIPCGIVTAAVFVLVLYDRKRKYSAA